MFIYGCICSMYIALLTQFIVQAQDNIMNLPLANGWGDKHRGFVKWKYVESKVYALVNFVLAVSMLMCSCYLTVPDVNKDKNSFDIFYHNVIITILYITDMIYIVPRTYWISLFEVNFVHTVMHVNL